MAIRSITSCRGRSSVRSCGGSGGSRAQHTRDAQASAVGDMGGAPRVSAKLRLPIVMLLPQTDQPLSRIWMIAGRRPRGQSCPCTNSRERARSFDISRGPYLVIRVDRASEVGSVAPPHITPCARTFPAHQLCRDTRHYPQALSRCRLVRHLGEI
jgi:hypothetical protein